jgi:tight adherence protein B
MTARMHPGLAAAAVVLVAAAAFVAVGSGPAIRRLRKPESAASVFRRLAAGRGAVIVGIAAVLGIAVLTGPVPGVVVVVAGLVVVRRQKQARRRKLARSTRVADLAALRALAAELDSGLSPADALRIAAGSTSPADGLGARMLAAADADASGADGSLALRGGSAPGSSQAALAAAWSLCQRTGSSLAGPVKRIAEGAAAQLRVEREAEAGLASAHASARLLAVLPFAGVALAQLSGAGAAQVLLTTGLGQACLAIGTGLDLAGLAWLDRLTAAAGG